MPIVEVKIFEGRTKEDRASVMRGITDVICETLSVPRGDVRVIITELQRENFSVGGEPKPFRPND